MGRPQKPLPLPETAEQQFGAELRFWREATGITAEQLGGIVGRDRRTITGAETGREIPSETLVVRLEQQLQSGGLLLARYDAVLAERRNRRRGTPILQRADHAPDSSLADASTFEGETVPDGTLMRPGERFEKTWTIRNSGTVEWRDRYLQRVGIASGTGLITTPARIAVSHVRPGESVTLRVACVAQYLQGTSQAAFKMADSDGRLYFADRYSVGLMVQITVR